MSYLHSVPCPKCGDRSSVCTPDKDGYEMDTKFEYVCPKCGRRILFYSQAVEILDSDSCPEGSIPGVRYKG